MFSLIPCPNYRVAIDRARQLRANSSTWFAALRPFSCIVCRINIRMKLDVLAARRARTTIPSQARVRVKLMARFSVFCLCSRFLAQVSEPRHLSTEDLLYSCLCDVRGHAAVDYPASDICARDLDRMDTRSPENHVPSHAVSFHSSS